MIDYDLVRQEYMKRIGQVDPRELKRNVAGQAFAYEHAPHLQRTFSSYYGDIAECCVRSVPIEL